MTDRKDGEAETPALDTAIQSKIGKQLRSMFDRVAAEPVPDRFLRLLESLENDRTAQPAPPSEMSK